MLLLYSLSPGKWSLAARASKPTVILAVSSPGNGIIEFVFFFFQSFYCLGCSFFSQCFYMNPMASLKMMMKTRKRSLRRDPPKLRRKRSQRKTALLCVPKIVETMLIHAHVDGSTFALQMALLTEVSVPMGYIGMMRKSKKNYQWIRKSKRMQ